MDTKEGGNNNGQVETDLTMSGRSSRECDVCARDAARWYCAADQAYLCLRCDDIVHSANSVASRHHRIHLNPTVKLPLPPIESGYAIPDSSILYHQQKLHKKRRSSRPIRSSSIAASMNASQLTNAPVAKTEPVQERIESGTIALRKPKIEEDDEASHEVPVFLPISHTFSPRSVGDCTLLVDANAVPCSDDALGFVVPDGFQSGAMIDIGPADDAGEINMMVSKEAASVIKVEEMAPMDYLEVFSLYKGEDFYREDYCMDFSCIEGFRESGGALPVGHRVEVEEVQDGANNETNGFIAEQLKMEQDSLEYGESMRMEVDEMLANEWNGCKEEEVKHKICLRLNYEDVLSAWSDRGPLWADAGPFHQIVPGASNYEGFDDALCVAPDHAAFLDTGLVPDLSFYSESSTTGDQPGKVPVVNFSEESISMRGREARVMRYREKRRTRLFSKKIRYEVRKLNAERRPRLKGRFVKKIASS